MDKNLNLNIYKNHNINNIVKKIIVKKIKIIYE